MTDKEEMLKILDFILNRSTYGDLEVIQEAIKRRTRDIRTGIGGIDVREIAKKTAQSIQKQIGTADEVTKMVRRFVKDIISQQQPEISEEQLEKILNRYVPAAKEGDSTGDDDSGGIEERLPPDIIQSMLVQFIDYSLGRMSAEEKKELAPDWEMRYWNVFSPRLRRLLSKLIKGKISEGGFWREYNKSGNEGV